MPRVVIFTGAGTSAEAGIPTFRVDADGKTALWNNVDPKQVCDMTTYKKNKELCRTFYNDFRNLVSKTQPTDFHHKIARWQNELRERGVDLCVMTQNVDDLFEKANVRDVTHVHGDIRNMHCISCNHNWHVGYDEQKPDDVCPACSSDVCKPGVIFFNEHAPAYENLIRTLESLSDGDILIAIGTSCSVFPIQYFFEKDDIYKIYSALELPRQLRGIPLDEVILGRCTEVIDSIRNLTDQVLNRDDFPFLIDNNLVTTFSSI